MAKSTTLDPDLAERLNNLPQVPTDVFSLILEQDRRNSIRNPTTHPVTQLLQSALTTFQERNAVYGDNWRQYGTVMAMLYPGGLHLETPDDFAKFSIISHLVGKLTRYVHQPKGHLDSAHDMIVYAAILEHLTPVEEF